MSRVVFLGGFGSGRTATEKVGKVLESHFEDVDAFTFTDYLRHPEETQRAAKGVTLITHSAGALSLSEQGIQAEFAYLLNPPLPRRVIGLIGRSLVKTARLYMPNVGLHSVADLAGASAFARSTTAELLNHPYANLSQLPKISSCNAVEVAHQAMDRGIGSQITWTTEDAYFKPTPLDLDNASTHSIPVKILEGEHDEVVLHPQAFLGQVLNG